MSQPPHLHLAGTQSQAEERESLIVKEGEVLKPCLDAVSMEKLETRKQEMVIC